MLKCSYSRCTLGDVQQRIMCFYHKNDKTTHTHGDEVMLCHERDLVRS